MEELTIGDSESSSMVSLMIGRTMNSLLNSRPKKLEDAITRFGDDGANRSSIASLMESLSLLDKYVRDAVERDEQLDDLLVPMIEHSLKCKGTRHVNQAMILLNWLFQDQGLFIALARNLAILLNRKEDHYIALSWCNLVRDLVDYETSMGQHLKNGIRARHVALLRILSSSVPRLSFILSSGSVLQDGFELPTRLSLAAADCVLILTQAVAKESLGSQMDVERSRSSKLGTPNKSVIPMVKRHIEQDNVHLDISSNTEMGVLLWENLEVLITVVQKLNAWSRKSRPLHGKGATLVLRWLQGIQTYYACFHGVAGSEALSAGVLLLASCWRHYSMLLRLDNHELVQRCNDLLDQYLSGIEFYSDAGTVERTEDGTSSVETRKFFLNCLTLLLGRLDSKMLASVMLEYELRVLDVLLSQFHCTDVDVVDEAACIFRLVFFKMTGGSVIGTQEMEAVLPKLLQLLDEFDVTSREITILIAEYCSLSADFSGIEEVLKRFASGNLIQRRNAADVISEFICLSSDSAGGHSSSFMQDIANHLLDRLIDEDAFVHTRATELLALIDPALVLPSLIQLICSSSDISASSSSVAFVGILRRHNQNFYVINMLLDHLSNFSQSQDRPKASEDIFESSPTLIADRVFRLIPEWTKSVKDWTPFLSPLLEKAFAQPSSTIIIRFLSCISDHLADAADIVLGRVLLQAKSQKEIDGSVFSGGEGKPYANSEMVLLQQMLFDRLSPLLIIKLLPLRVFDDLDSTIMYSQFLRPGVTLEGLDIGEYECVAAYLLNRALNQFEFDSVRKLAAELCGRIHPHVLLPVAFSQLQGAVEIRDLLKIKACLFSICTSLMIRGRDSLSHPVIYKIERIIHRILLWPSTDGDEVSKAQHGGIDCLALMIYAELLVSEPLQDSASDRSPFIENATLERTVLSSVIDDLTNEKLEIGLLTEVFEDGPPRTITPFRLCMANVLISACQKISESSKNIFVKKTFPRLIPFIKGRADPDIRAAAIQVLFSSVYHLKLAILPYASDLLRFSMQLLRDGTDKERVAASKLMAALMASDVAVIEKISKGLLEARSVLSSVYMSDPSEELREICQKLLQCLTS